MTMKVLNRLPQSGPSRPIRLSAARGVGGAVVGLLHTLQLVHTLRRVLEDRLKGTALLQHLRGQVFLTHFQAVQALGAQPAEP